MLNNFVSSPIVVTAIDHLHRSQTSALAWLAGCNRFLVTSSGALLVLLAVILAWAYFYPFDAAELLNGDALYPVQMTHYGVFDFRPPPPNRIVPDVAVHWLLRDAITDPLWQKVAAGCILGAAVFTAVAVFKGVGAVALIAVIYTLAGFQFLNSSYHYTLPLMLILAQLCRGNRWLENTAYAFIAFTNILAMFPLAVLMFGSADTDRRTERLASAVVGVALAAVYADFGSDFIKLAVVLPVWILAVHMAHRAGLLPLVLLAVGGTMLIAAIGDALAFRYAAPIAASLLVVATPFVAPRLHWRGIAVAVVVVGAAAGFADYERAYGQQARFACLARALHDRYITAVAADHWTSKPLYFAAKERGDKLNIAQVDFRTGTTHIWIAPYDFYGAPGRWSVHSNLFCGLYTNDSRYCGQSETAQVEHSEKVCGAFTIYRYASHLPVNFTSKPVSKVEAIQRQISGYAEGVFARFWRSNNARPEAQQGKMAARPKVIMRH